MASVQKRGDKWRLIAYLGYNELGNQIRKIKHIPMQGTSKIEATRLANKFEADLVKRGKATSIQTINNIIEYWWEHYGNSQSPTTIERNKILFKRIKALLGHIRANKLSAKHIHLFIEALKKKNARLDGKGDLSSRSISMHYKLLSSVLNKAVRWGLIDENPCLRVDAPKEKTKPQPILQENDLAKFLNLLMTKASLKHRTFFLLAFTDGLRRSEICGLDEQHIDFENGTFKIVQTAVTVNNKIVIKEDTKTASSSTTMHFSPITLKILKEYIAERKQIEKALGFKHSTLVFSNPDGTPITMDSYLKWLHRFLNKHELPKVNIQGFRKMAITYAMQKVNLKEASQFGRHSNIGTTAKYYAEVLQSRMATPTNYLDDIVQNAIESEGKNIN